MGSIESGRTSGIAAVLVLLCGTTVVLALHFGGSDRGRQPGRTESTFSALDPASPRSLTSHQFIRTQATMTIAVTDLTPNHNGEVIVPAVAQQWTNEGITCLQVAFGSPNFSSAAQRSAWVATGLSTTPLRSQPQGFCVENLPGGGALATSSGHLADLSAKVLTQGLGVVDVSKMSTDPSTLAQDLQSGHTGNRTFDEAVAQRSYPNPGFERAILLLQMPTIGETNAFRIALPHALPLIPGVASVGREHTAGGN
jgi:hypothetical protein